MARHLIIVSREEPPLYGYLLERFHGDENVAIVLDRRSGHDRRLHGGLPPSAHSERRETERRTRSAAEDELRSRRHVIITLADGP